RLSQNVDRERIVAQAVMILAQEEPHGGLERRVAELQSNDERTVGVVDGALALGDFVIVVSRKGQDLTQTAPITDGVGHERCLAENLDDSRQLTEWEQHRAKLEAKIDCLL